MVPPYKVDIDSDIGRFVALGGVISSTELFHSSGYAVVSISVDLYQLARPAG